MLPTSQDDLPPLYLDKESFNCRLANAPSHYYITERDTFMGPIMDGQPLYEEDFYQQPHLDMSQKSTHDSTGTYDEPLNSTSALITDF